MEGYMFIMHHRWIPASQTSGIGDQGYARDNQRDREREREMRVSYLIAIERALNCLLTRENQRRMI